MQTDTERLSPVIDLQRLNLITTTNRIDDPVDDYASDARVNLSIGDPHSASYVSKKVRLATLQLLCKFDSLVTDILRMKLEFFTNSSDQIFQILHNHTYIPRL